jgi:hypothetical protein
MVRKIYKMISVFLFSICFFKISTGQGQNDLEANIKTKADDGPFTCCFDSVKKEINLSQVIIFSKYDLEKLVIGNKDIVFKEEKNRIHGPTVRKWLKNIDRETLRVYKAANDRSIVYLISSNFYKSSGLATEMNAWIVIEANTKSVFSYSSLSDSPGFFYCTNTNGHFKLHAFIFDYSKEFIHYRDYDNPSVVVKHIVLSGNNEKIISERVLKCKCK